MIGRPIVVILLVAAGCASRPASKSPKEAPMVAQTDSETQHTPMLVTLPVAGGRYGLPPAWDEGSASFDRAFDLATKGQHADAAELFMDTAELFRIAAGDPHEGTFATARDQSYANAWECYQAAGLRDEGKQRLERAAKGDPELASRIKQRLKEGW